LLAHPDARRYLAGQALSLLGDSSMWMACGIWVKTLTGSNAAAGLTFLFFTAPALLAPIAGVLVDRVRRRPLLIAANLAGALILMPLLLVRDQGDVWLIYAVMALYGTLNVLIAPAQSALLAGLLPAELLASANGVLRTVQEGLRVLAPLIGAGLFALVGGHAVALLDIVTFLAAAGFVVALRHTETPARRSAEAPDRVGAGWIRRTGREIGAGFAFIAGHASLRRVTAATAVATLVIGFGESTVYAVVSDGLHRSPEFVGITQMTQGIGAILSGLTAATAVRRFGEIRVAAFGIAMFAVGPALMAISTLPTVLAGKLAGGLGLPWIVIALLTLLQRVTPGNLQGRVFAGFEVATTGPQTVSIALGAALITVLDYRIVLGIESVVLLLSAALLARMRPTDRDTAIHDRPDQAHVELRALT
jgi:MFS family permease